MSWLRKNWQRLLAILIGLVGFWLVVINPHLTKDNISKQDLPKEIEAEAITKEELFEKNLECLKYKDQIEKNYLSKGYPKEYWRPELQEIFYSAELNSCLYVEYVYDPLPSLIMKRLMDVRQGVGTEPIRSCEEFNRAAWLIQEKDFVKELGQKETEKLKALIENKNCDNFDLYVESIK